MCFECRSSVSDAWVLDGTHTAHRGSAVICLLKRLQMPLAVCHAAQSSLQTHHTPLPCVDGPAQGTICTVGGQKKSGYEFQPQGLMSSCRAAHSFGIGRRLALFICSLQTIITSCISFHSYPLSHFSCITLYFSLTSSNSCHFSQSLINHKFNLPAITSNNLCS